MSTLLRKTFAGVIAALIVLSVVPSGTALAARAADETPPPATDSWSEWRLERTWARQLRRYERIGRLLERSEVLLTRMQERIDEWEAQSADVTAVQAALDAFEGALKDVHPLYESLNGLVTSHQGFDDDGHVTDRERARETVAAMHDALAAMREAMDGTFEALREAMREFREANRPNEAV